IIVGLGQVSAATAKQQQLADVVLVEVRELLVCRLVVQYCAHLRVMQTGKERHPDYFLECFGTFRSDIDPVTVRSFARRLVAVARASDEPVPEPWRQHRREIAVAMTGDGGM